MINENVKRLFDELTKAEKEIEVAENAVKEDIRIIKSGTIEINDLDQAIELSIALIDQESKDDIAVVI